MQDEGRLLLPRSSTGTILLELRPETGHTFAPFGSPNHRKVPMLEHTVTPFKFAAIKVRGFEIMTYSRPFNFAFPIKIISRFPTQMLCFPTQIKVGTLCVKDHQVLRLELRLA